MDTREDKTIIVFGATGRMGGAVARHLHRAGWRVKGISRNPASEKSQALIAQGINVVAGDMDAPDTLRPAFKDAYGVFLTVNWFDVGIDGELRQSKHVVDVAADSTIQHLVFGAAGIGERTGLEHFDVKLEIVDYLQSKNVPTSVIYPPPFMEMMTDPTFFPQLVAWNAKVKIVGKNLAVPWIATDDIGALAALIFDHPDEYLGRGLKPFGDWKTLGECIQLYQEAAGKKPFRIPLPLWLMRRMIPQMADMIAMWEWMAAVEDLPAKQTDSLSDFLNDVTDVRSFFQQAFSGN